MPPLLWTGAYFVTTLCTVVYIHKCYLGACCISILLQAAGGVARVFGLGGGVFVLPLGGLLGSRSLDYRPYRVFVGIIIL